MEVNPESIVSPCEAANARWHNFALWRNLWTILIFAFGSAVVFFLVVTIVLFIRQAWVPGAITTLTTIVQGAAIKWVLSRRGEAVVEEQQAYQDMQARCGSTSDKVNQITSKQKLFGLVR
jgi:hypothetical protein